MSSESQKKAMADALAEAGLVPKSHRVASGDQMFVKRRFVPATASHNKPRFSVEKDSRGFGDTAIGNKTHEHGLLSLKDVWEQHNYRKALREYLERHFCAESIEFLEAVDRYRQVSKEERTPLGKKILDQFFDSNAESPVNIDGNTHAELLAKGRSSSSMSNDFFDTAMKQIYELLENDIYQRFLMSSDYKKMIGEDKEKEEIKKRGEYKKKIEEVAVSPSDEKYIKKLCDEQKDTLLAANWVLIMSLDEQQMPAGRLLVITDKNIYTITHTLFSRSIITKHSLNNLEDMSAYPGEQHVRLDFIFRYSEPPRFSIISHYATSQTICTTLIEATSSSLMKPLFSVTSNSDSQAEVAFRAEVYNEIIKQKQKENIRKLESIRHSIRSDPPPLVEEDEDESGSGSQTDDDGDEDDS